MTELLQNLPADPGLAMIYVQHLDRFYDSNLTDIFSRVTAMKVFQAVDGMKIEPDCVYVIPPNKEMSVKDGYIHVFNRPSEKGIHLPIDHLFLSLAENNKNGSVGILLSGAASDGTIGLKAIRMAGGLTIAQDSSAQFQSMPQSAIAEGIVDLVLPPNKIAAELVTLGQKAKSIDIQSKLEEETVSLEEEQQIKNILHVLKKAEGADFTHYKINTIRRRIFRRVLLYKMENLVEYLEYIKKHPIETRLLYSDLLINVTLFFRDEDSIDYLSKVLFPKLLENKDPLSTIRIWIPACSTGEEAYSIAMILSELLEDQEKELSIQIFATDLSEKAIIKARSGTYSLNELGNVSKERIKKFFTRIDGHYRVNKNIRDLCVFAVHNVFTNPPFSKIDLVSCCNLLIYLDATLQRKLMSTFYYSLNEQGYLLLGNSETVGASSSLFVPLDKKVRVFSKKGGKSNRPAFDVSYQLTEKEKIEFRPIRRETNEPNHPNPDRLLDSIFLSEFTPPSLLINTDLHILQFRGAINMYLEPAHGRASLNILKMVRQDLVIDLRSLIQSA